MLSLSARAGTQDTPQAESQSGYDYQDRVVVQSTVEEIMARPEFLRLRVSEREQDTNAAWLERFLDWLAELFTRNDEVRSTTESGPFAADILYAIALLIILGALAFIVRSVLASAKQRELVDDGDPARIARSGAAPGETSPDEYWARAHALAAAGNEKLALRQLLLGAMSHLERQGAIRHRRGLTNRDYFWAATGRARESLRVIIAAFEQVYFGRRDVTAARFRECAHAYDESFRTRLAVDSVRTTLTSASGDRRG